MPFTPYHLGPSGFLGLIFRKWIDIPVFVLANVIIDVEVLVLAGVGVGWPRHGFCHTMVVGAIVGLLWGIVAYPLRHRFTWMMCKLHMPYETSFRKMAVSGILGMWLHVLIDGLYHFDAKIFWPDKILSIRRLIYRCCTYIGTNRIYRHEIVEEQIKVVAIGFGLATVITYLLIRKTSCRNVTSGFLKLCIGRKRFWLLVAVIVTALYGIYLYNIFPENKITEAHDAAANELSLSESLTVTNFEAIKDEDLLGCWRFDTGTGTTALDFSDNGNTASIAGANWTHRATGYALEFDGIDDFVKIVSDPSLDNLEAITLAAWIYPRVDSHWHVLDKGDGHRRIYSEGIKRKLCGRVRYTGTHAYSESVCNTIVLNRWQHIALTWSQATDKIRIFLNGLEVEYSLQEVGSGVLLDDSEYPFFIGSRGNLDDVTFFDGYIDDVYLYDRALSPREVLVIYGQFSSNSYRLSGENKTTLLK